MSVKIEGEAALLKALRKYSAETQKAVLDAIEKTAVEVRNTAVRSIQTGPKSGITYVRAGGQNASRTHTASAPGEAPANDKGRLARSMLWKRDGNSAIVGSTVTGYPHWLEFGTVNMEPRPFLRPALDANKEVYLARLKKIHDEALKA
jgi:HK97 gp10 family phage protein